MGQTLMHCPLRIEYACTSKHSKAIFLNSSPKSMVWLWIVWDCPSKHAEKFDKLAQSDSNRRWKENSTHREYAYAWETDTERERTEHKLNSKEYSQFLCTNHVLREHFYTLLYNRTPSDAGKTRLYRSILSVMCLCRRVLRVIDLSCRSPSSTPQPKKSWTT